MALTRWVTGEPFGPAAGIPLPVGPAGIASTLLELLAIAALLTGPRLARRPLRAVAPVLAASVLVVAAPTVWGVNGAMAHDHGSHTDADDHDGEHHDESGEGHHDAGTGGDPDAGSRGDEHAPEAPHTDGTNAPEAPATSPERSAKRDAPKEDSRDGGSHSGDAHRH